MPPQGTTAMMTRAGMTVMIGARIKISLSALAGISSSLKISLTPSAIGCSQPPRPGPVGADAHLDARQRFAFVKRQIGKAGQSDRPAEMTDLMIHSRIKRNIHRYLIRYKFQHVQCC